MIALRLPKEIVMSFLVTLMSSPLASSVQFVEIATLHPSQIRYSSENVQDKIAKALKNGDAMQEAEAYSFKYDNGRSMFGESDVIPVVAVGTSYVLCDGHHSVLAARKLGACTMPVRVVETYDGEINEQFWEWAQEHGYAHLTLLGSDATQYPTNFDALIDDPLRYFAAIAARKFEKSTRLDQSTGAEFPLWVKVGKDIPFLEFKIADMLHKHGFTYAYGDEKQNFKALIEQARAILREHSVPGLKLVEECERFDESSQIRAWLNHSS